MDIWQVRENSPAFNSKYILADGGCNKIGDLVKSLCVADMVISGNLFSGCLETPGKIIEIENKKYKSYVGSSTHRKDFVEGVEGLVEVKPSIQNILVSMMQGISSGCSYTGSFNLKELQKNAEFVKITSAGQKESGAHDILLL
jgi:IMP dehydrogenase